MIINWIMDACTWVLNFLTGTLPQVPQFSDMGLDVRWFVDFLQLTNKFVDVGTIFASMIFIIRGVTSLWIARCVAWLWSLVSKGGSN